MILKVNFAILKIQYFQDVLNFGRDGAGAPVRDDHGHVKAVVVGNPEIRFRQLSQKL